MERHSATPMVFLHGLPRWVLPIGLALLLASGMIMKGWPAAIPLLLLTAFLGWFGYLSWPALDLSGRLLRIAACAVLIGISAVHLSGRF